MPKTTPRKVPDENQPHKPLLANLRLNLSPECWVTIRRAQVILATALGRVPSKHETVDFLLSDRDGHKLLFKAIMAKHIEVSAKHMPKGNRNKRAARPSDWS